MRRVRPLLLSALALLPACAGGDDDAAEPPTAPPSSAVTTVEAAAATTAAPSPTALVPGTDGGDPLYPEPTPPPTDPLITIPAATTAPTAPPGMSATNANGTPTSEPVAVQELILSGDGLGTALFGTEPEAVIQYVASILGGDTGDSGWVAPETFGCFAGNEVRRVDWGVLSLLFSDASDLATGRRHFMGWEYGRLGAAGDEPVGLRTAGGVTIGSRVVDVLGEFPEATLVEGDPDVEIPDQVYVDDSFIGWVSGVTEDDFVTVLFGGVRCGG